MMKACQNKRNIIRYVDNCMTNNSVLIFMEYCNEGSLEEYLKKMKIVSETKAI